MTLIPHVETKGSPISKAPVKQATHIVPPRAARGAECQTTTAPVAAPCALLNRTPVVFVGRVGSLLSRTSHPSGSRPRSEPRRDSTPAPGTSVPQTTVGTQPCPLDTAQDVWLPGGATPCQAHGRGVSVPAPVARAICGVGTGANREYGVAPQPLYELPAPPLVYHTEPKARCRSNGTCSRTM